MRRREFLAVGALAALRVAKGAEVRKPNLIFILTDDQRFDALGCVDPLAVTPNMDALAKRGVRFDRVLVATSICAPSRACCLTGRYGRANGVPGFGTSLRKGETTFAQILKRAGYRTGYVGKWHLPSPKPKAAGFDSVMHFMSNGPHMNRKVIDQGKPTIAKGFIEDYIAEKAIAFMEGGDGPFLLHIGTQVPHMDHRFSWPSRPETRARFRDADMPVPASWQDDLSGKPPYLKTSRSRQRGVKYGYREKAAIQKHWADYLAAIADMDASLGKVLAALDRLGQRENTWIILMGDNGWFMGEHGFTSKVLPYEESIRVPFIVAGPGLKGTVCKELILNADIAPTLLELAGEPVPERMQGKSLVPLLHGNTKGWRTSILYEALKPELGSWPLVAVRDARWKYIRTFDIKDRTKVVFEELYDLDADPHELHNVIDVPANADTVARLKAELARLEKEIS
ncbi:sulfatase-like hydrolase/transferase [bacterium]|nr:sulfatase-like hydrolase/transferase [bacterium]